MAMKFQLEAASEFAITGYTANGISVWVQPARGACVSGIAVGGHNVHRHHRSDRGRRHVPRR